MEYRQLGRTGLRISEISFGNWLTQRPSDDKPQAKADQERAVECIHAALEAGVTLFDTADVYANGYAETVLASALRDVRRSSYVLASKVFFPTGEAPTDRGLSRKHIIESCHASLRRLGTDYLDIYYCHRYEEATPLEETLRALEDLVRAGKVLYVGVSEWRADQMGDALRIAGERGFDRIVASQPQYSMLHRVIEPHVVPLCQREGIGQVVFSPIAQGVLTGKYAPGTPPPPGSRATDERGKNFISRWMRDEVLERVAQLRPLAGDCGLTMAQLAVAWTLQNDNVASAIIGASRPEQVAENVAAAGVRLPADVLARIDEVLGPVVNRGGQP